MGYRINVMLGEKIARERRQRGISQEEMASRVKIATTTLSNIENGKSDTSIYTISKIADVLHMHIRDLFKFR